MREDIKERIVKIENGDCPDVYKRTKIGVLPNDWEVSELSPYLVEAKQLSNDIERYPLYSSARKGLLKQSEYYNNREAVETNLGYKIVPKGFITYRHMSDDDVFYFNVNNTGTEILVSSEYPVFITKNLNLSYLVEHLNNMPRFRHFCRAQKLGGTRTRLYYKALKGYIMPLPSRAEQDKIAEILTQCDKIVALKQQLIEEERNRKKRMQQQLFVSKSIHHKPLKDLCTIIMGQSPDSKSYNAESVGIPLIQGNGDISNRLPSPHIFTSAPQKTCIKGDIILSVRAPVGMVSRSNITACLGRGVCAIRSKEYADYLYQFLLYSENKWGQISQGSTFDAVSGNEIGKVMVPIVNNIEESAGALMSIDAERMLLEQELIQWQQKKKALMQLLLTGIVRVTE